MKVTYMPFIFAIVAISLVLGGLVLSDYERASCKQRGLELNRTVEDILRICR
jgi:hypothetical protein